MTGVDYRIQEMYNSTIANYFRSKGFENPERRVQILAESSTEYYRKSLEEACEWEYAELGVHASQGTLQFLAARKRAVESARRG